MLPKNNYVSLSYVVGDKAFAQIITVKDYPYGLKKLKTFFYSGNGSMCFPVEKSISFISIIVRDPMDRSKIAGRSSQVSAILKGFPDGKYVIDFEKMKVIYDIDKHVDLVPFTVVYLSVSKEKLPPYVLGVSITEDGKKELVLIKDKYIQFAEFLTGSNYMVEGNKVSEFAAQVYLRIMQNYGMMGELDSQVYGLESFLIPQGKSDVYKGIEDDLATEVNKIFGKNKTVTTPKKLLLSEILEKGVLPTNFQGKERRISVDIDVKPEGVNIISGYVEGDDLYLVVDNNLEKDVDKLSSISDLDFIIWMSVGKEEEVVEENDDGDLSTELDAEGYRFGME